MRIAGVLVMLIAAGAGAQPSSVVDSVHNLSATGPGSVRASIESQVCIFCHTPHNAAPIRPLWNRATPPDAYSIYTSRALDALPGQPTGSSKMCLSCHDGTIALGAVLSRPDQISMQGGVVTMPAGTGRLGTDLRDDHPISFRFDSSLASRDPHLRSPAALPSGVRLDPNGELQCTTCHDAHSNRFGRFLVMRNSNSELCTSCHAVGTTAITAHADCIACHQQHTAPSGPYLLRGRTVADTCLACHDGSAHDAPDVAADLRKRFAHETRSPVDAPGSTLEHVTCTSCHEPHTMGRGAAVGQGLHPNFGRIAGVSASGAPLTVASAEHEVCFRCHADGSRIAPTVPRRIAQNNTRLEFAASAISSHPVLAPSRAGDSPSLLPGWNVGATLKCSDCHASDTGALAGGAGARGTHGSQVRPLLAARYETADFTSESHASYALCYQCHDRGSILSDQSFPTHRLHIVDHRTPCAACHDAHGIASTQGNMLNNSHLINFATNIVHPDPATGRLEFRDLGRFRGECFLSCHGSVHSPKGY